MRSGVASRTPLFIVCSPQQRVGRTLVARLLLDFLLMEDRSVAGFDFDAEPPSLADFLPGQTTIAEITDIQPGQNVWSQQEIDQECPRTAQYVEESIGDELLGKIT